MELTMPKGMTNINNAFESKKRLGNIELLRFVFASMVVLHHAILPVFYGGWLGVEFFFIISGFYMAKNLEKGKDLYEKEHISITAKSGRDYLWKRFASIFPYVIISTLIGFVIQLLDCTFGSSIKDQISYIFILPYEFLFLQNYGYRAMSCTGTVWYLSAMFFALWLLYPIIRRHFDLFTGYIAPGLALFIAGYLERNYGMLGSACDWLPSGANSGFLRAIAEISWGTFVYRICSKFSRINIVSSKKILLTVIELLSYAICFIYMYKWKLEYGYLDPLWVIGISIAIVITVSGHSCLYGLFDNKVIFFLGKFSVVLFMNHAYWLFHIVSLAGRYGVQLSEIRLKLIGIVLSYITTAIVYVIGNKMSNLGRIIKGEIVG